MYENKLKYQKGYKYKVYETFVTHIPIYPDEDIVTDFIMLRKDGGLTVKSGYTWDGASGPTKDGKGNMRGSLLHDVPYQLMRMGLLPLMWRGVADDILKEVCILDSKWKRLSKVRYSIWHWAVRKFALKSATSEGIRKVYIAPLLIMLLFAFPAFAAERNIYFDSTQLVAGDGSKGNPYNALSQLNWTTGGSNSIFDWSAADDDIYINLNGRFNRDPIVQTCSGTSAHPITIRGYGPGAKPMLSYSHHYTGTWTNVAGNLWYTNYDAPSTTGSELIGNGTFEANDTNWVAYENDDTGEADFERINDAGNGADGSDWYYRVTVNTAGDNETDIILKSPRFDLGLGDSYVLEFDIQSDANDDMWNPQAYGYSAPGSSYGLDRAYVAVSTTTSWVTKTFYFTSQYDSTLAAAQSHAMIRFLYGIRLGVGPATGRIVEIDNVTLHKVTNTNNILFMDIGEIKLNDGEFFGQKKASTTAVLASATQGDFFINGSDKFNVYMYSVGDPSAYYDKIEFLGARPLIHLEGESHFVIDGIDFRDTAYNGIFIDETGYFNQGTELTENITIRNCNFLDIGGMWGVSTNVRAGNGITIWDGQDEILVEDCTFRNCYDNAITSQGTDDTITDVTFQDNDIDKCELPIVVWLKTNGTELKRINILNNRITNTGFQASHEGRPDGKRARAIQLGYSDGPTIEDIVVTGNLLYRVNDDDNGFLYKQRPQFDNTNTTFENNVLWQDVSGDGLIEVGHDGGGDEYIKGQLIDYQTDYSMGTSCQEANPLLAIIFKDGSIFNKQSNSSDYLLNSDTPVIKLPWSENYEIRSSFYGTYQSIRQPYSENYLFNGNINVNRKPHSEDYESALLNFIRQPNSNNYLVEEKIVAAIIVADSGAASECGAGYDELTGSDASGIKDSDGGVICCPQ